MAQPSKVESIPLADGWTVKINRNHTPSKYTIIRGRRSMKIDESVSLPQCTERSNLRLIQGVHCLTVPPHVINTLHACGKFSSKYSIPTTDVNAESSKFEKAMTHPRKVIGEVSNSPRRVETRPEAVAGAARGDLYRRCGGNSIKTPLHVTHATHPAQPSPSALPLQPTSTPLHTYV